MFNTYLDLLSYSTIQKEKKPKKLKHRWFNDKETWLDKVKDFFYVDLKFYKIRDLYLGIKNFPRKTWRVIRYLPDVYHYEPWDYGHLLDLIKRPLADMEKHFGDRNKVYMIEKQRKAIHKDIKELLVVINRMRDEEYDWDKYMGEGVVEHPDLVSTPIEGGEYYRVGFKYSSPEAEKLYNKKHKQYYTQKERRYKKDVERFGDLLKKFNTWWD